MPAVTFVMAGSSLVVTIVHATPTTDRLKSAWAASDLSHMTDPPQPRPRSRVLGRVWADLPLRVRGLVVVAIPLLALLLATALFGVALAQDRRAQGAVLHTVEVERQIAQVRILVQAGVTGYVLTGERRYLTSYEAARQELPRSTAHLGELVSDNPGQVDRVAKVEAVADRRTRALALGAIALSVLPGVAGGVAAVMFRGCWAAAARLRQRERRAHPRLHPCRCRWSRSRWPTSRPRRSA
jgi:hypothetical protein